MVVEKYKNYSELPLVELYILRAESAADPNFLDNPKDQGIRDVRLGLIS